MRRLIPVFLGVLITTSPAAAGHLTADVRPFCESVSQSYSTQLFCIKDEQKAIARIDAQLHAGTIDARIWQYCAGIGLRSWSTSEFCMKDELASKRALGK